MTGSVAQGQRQRDKALNYSRTFSPTRQSQNKDCPQSHSLTTVRLAAFPPEVSDTQRHRDLANIACQSLSHRARSGDSLSSKHVVLRKQSQGRWKTWKMQECGVEVFQNLPLRGKLTLQLPLCRSCDRFVFVFLFFFYTQ